MFEWGRWIFQQDLELLIDEKQDDYTHLESFRYVHTSIHPSIHDVTAIRHPGAMKRAKTLELVDTSGFEMEKLGIFTVKIGNLTSNTRGGFWRDDVGIWVGNSQFFLPGKWGYDSIWDIYGISMGI